MTDHGVAMQFDDVGQQKEAASLGMWAFIATEVLFFGGLFCAYAAYRVEHFQVFAQASQVLNVWLGGTNTAVLLTSSLTEALAVHAVGRGRGRRGTALLLVTITLAAAFLCIKGYEYAHKAQEGLVPGSLFSPREELHLPAGSELFFTLYFVMTGLHALHVIVGMGLLAVVAHRTWRCRASGGISPHHTNLTEVSVLYWHFVDMVWIFLFPLLYLIERSGGP